MGVPIIRTIVFGVCIGVPYFGKLPYLFLLLLPLPTRIIEIMAVRVKMKNWSHCQETAACNIGYLEHFAFSSARGGGKILLLLDLMDTFPIQNTEHMPAGVSTLLHTASISGYLVPLVLIPGITYILGRRTWRKDFENQADISLNQHPDRAVNPT